MSAQFYKISDLFYFIGEQISVGSVLKQHWLKARTHSTPESTQRSSKHKGKR